MTILVTGGAGFIGSNLLHHLVKNVDQNIELVKRILFILDKDLNMIEYVQDRLGHDRRYSTDITKIKNEIG
jgi:dTDP-D-glucose 4,6-dehydratase